MLEELKSKFPNFCSEDDSNWDLFMSDDLDSHASCVLQKILFNREVNYFMDFNKSYVIQDGQKQNCQMVYRVQKSDNPIMQIDLTTESQCPSWDNHVSLLNSNDLDTVNTQSANINAIYKITNNSFFDKYCGSTLLQMMSFHGYCDNVIDSWSDEKKLILGEIDSLKTPFKKIKYDFKPTAKKWLHLMEYDNLSQFIEREVDKNGFQSFDAVKEKYNLNGKITVGEDRKLQTDIKLQELSNLFEIDLSLPEFEFSKFKRYDRFDRNIKYNPVISKKGLIKEGYSRIFNAALTNKNFIVYSLVKDKSNNKV
jgi:hypothetical protein